MEATTVGLTVHPAADAARGRKKPRRRIDATASVPQAASLPAQIVAFLALAALVGGGGYVASTASNSGVQTLAGVLAVLAGVVLVVWAALALGTGMGPKQILAILKELLAAVSSSTSSSGSSSGSTSSSTSTGGS